MMNRVFHYRPIDLTTTELFALDIELAERLITRRRFIIGAVGLLGASAVAGCDRGQDTTAPAAMTQMIRIEHAGGVTEVTPGVKRIVTLDGHVDLHTLIALGYTPIMTGLAGEWPDYPPLVHALPVGSAEIEILPRGIENIERIAAVQPQLILSAEYDSERYDLLSEMAPTILLDRYELDVDGHVRTVATALRSPEAAERVIAAFEERVAEVHNTVAGTAMRDTPFAVVMQHGFNGTFRMLGRTSYCGRTLAAVGANRLIDPDVGEPDGSNGEFGIDVSRELLADVLGPVAFIVMAISSPFTGAEPLSNSPLWERIPAVQEGAMVEVNEDIWYQDTALNRMARLDDIEALVRQFG